MVVDVPLWFALFLLPIFALFFLLPDRKRVGKPFPKSYPLIGSSIALHVNRDTRIQWMTEILRSSPAATFLLPLSLGRRNIFTAHPDNVRHILKTRFDTYQKGNVFCSTLGDFLGDGIFNADGDNWKTQRQVSSHEFNTNSLRKFIGTVVKDELTHRLMPILSAAAKHGTVLDLQDILQRFAFDNICQIAFGYDPAHLSASLPRTPFAMAFEDAAFLSSSRFSSVFPFIWKIRRHLNIGSEKKLRLAINEVRTFAMEVVRSKKEGQSNKSNDPPVDLLSRFLASGHSDETFITDIVISFILAGRDTTSAALTWFFWLISENPHVERNILDEIGVTPEATDYDYVKGMWYTHASLCETMRLYPPVPADTKEAVADDVLPTGMEVTKGTRVTYHPYAMGRMENLWGVDWPEFRPERWLRAEPATGEWSFVNRDSYEYPVFQAGPRICLGKEMAFLQMKRVVAAVLRQFRIKPVNEGFEPVFISGLTSKMKGGFRVKIEGRL